MKTKYNLIAIIAIFILVTIIFGGAYFNKDKVNSKGDKLGEMTVVDIAPFNSGQYSNDPENIKIGPHNVKLLLKGPILVTGTYRFVNSAIGSSGYCMSDFDIASLSRLPYLPIDNNKPAVLFCFRNVDFVKSKLGEKSAVVTVKIDNYEINSYPTEVVDEADLIEVFNR